MRGFLSNTSIFLCSDTVVAFFAMFLPFLLLILQDFGGQLSCGFMSGIITRAPGRIKTKN
jgi:hypothetical protein